MKSQNKITTILIALGIILMLAACDNSNPNAPEEFIVANDYEALNKIVETDESIQSFELNYNEEDVMDFLSSGMAKITTEIYPIRYGQKMVLVDRVFETEIVGDTAYATLTKTFDGVLFVAASFDETTASMFGGNSGMGSGQGDCDDPIGDGIGNHDGTGSNSGNGGKGKHGSKGSGNNGENSGNYANGGFMADTLISKSFTTTVTRKIIFEKIAEDENPLNNWRMVATSLPEGGTITENIAITKVTVDLPDGEKIEVENPNDYYIFKGPGHSRQMPHMGRGEQINLTVELQSAYADTDYVSLTYGAMKKGKKNRAKKLFELVSSEFDGTVYNKVYKGTWEVRQARGYKHAVINVLPKQVLYDTTTPVEEKSWGIPYKVN